MPFNEKFHLRIPGPTPIPPRIQQAMTHPMIGHRSSEASTLIRECSDRLKRVFGTQQQPLLLTSSGTSALEAAVVNLLAPREEAIVVVTGAFGERFAKVVERYGFRLHRLNIPWGNACDPDTLKHFIQSYPNVQVVFFTYCETSTGVLNPITELIQVVHRYSDALVVVDGVSCLGAVLSQMDNWNIDILITGSQKAMMLPPGLAFMAVSERAWNKMKQNSVRSFYLDLLAYRSSLEKDSTPYTPAISLLLGLKEALNMLDEEGFNHVIERHHLLKKMTRAGVSALGLKLMTSEQDASPTVTSIYGGEGWRSDDLRHILRQLGMVVAGGQQHLKGEIFRIGHMGYCDAFDIITVLSALEMALTKMNVPIDLGAGVRAAQEVWRDHV
ncbi:aspartate aminotransferase [Thermoactinomyces sp. DSM 45891]|uniref:pyridoxal-phosphate-dependent aminotransferase family protein n=1 Tax=Thermoactinomyces sp. DSM 45891 TaxID=1761907 RepID=UPI000922D179|nr:alanine--glyoxylate aminotransferase family protein [Thermoactinomyces sp. DSM 45891]SFX80874.1 aspartate aminotransferase [Thermoactinomyces sp. DSM 45891]